MTSESKTDQARHVNLDDARNFLELLHGSEVPVVTWQTFDDDSHRKSKALVWGAQRTLDQAEDHLTELNRKGAGVYTTLCRMKKGKPRSNKAAEVALAVAADLDHVELPEAFPLPPSIIVESSKGRHWVIWLIEATDNLEAWKACQKRLAKFYGGDPAVCDPARVCRVPGFYHCKGEPFLARVKSAVELDSVRLGDFARYTLADVENAHPVMSEILSSSATGDSRKNTTEPACWDEPRDIEAAKSYLATLDPSNYDKFGDLELYKAVCRVRDYAVSESVAADLLDEFNERAASPWSDADLDAKIKNAYKYAQNPAGSKSIVAACADAMAPEWIEAETSANAHDANKRPRFKPWTVDEMETLPDTNWLIHKLIPANRVFMVFGPPKAGKTFLCIDMGLCIATGKDWCGRKVKKGPALHIVAEGGLEDVRNRMMAWLLSHPKEQRDKLLQDIRANWSVIDTPVIIANPQILSEFLKTIGPSYSLIILDTLLRNFSGNVSEQKDMQSFVVAFDQIREAKSSAILIAHHEGKNSSKGSLGSISLDAAVDGSARLSKDGRDRIFEIKLMRGASDNQPKMVFTLEDLKIIASVNPEVEDVVGAVLKLKMIQAKAEPSLADKLLVAIYQAHRANQKPSDRSMAAALNLASYSAITAPKKALRDRYDMVPDGWTLTQTGEARAATMVVDE